MLEGLGLWLLLRAFASGGLPFLRWFTVGGARSHHDLMADVNEFCGKRIANHSATEDCDFHKMSLQAFCR